MRTKIFRRGLLHKYKETIIEKNYYGLIITGLIFIGLFLLDMIMKIVLGRGQNTIVFTVCAIVCALLLVCIHIAHKRCTLLTRVMCFLWYICGFGLTVYAEIVHPHTAAVTMYALIAVGLAIGIIMDPILFVCLQILGNIAFNITTIVSNVRRNTMTDISYAIIIGLFIIIVGIIMLYVRIENIVFESELRMLSYGNSSMQEISSASNIYDERPLLNNTVGQENILSSFVFSVNKRKVVRIGKENHLKVMIDMKISKVIELISSMAQEEETIKTVKEILDSSYLSESFGDGVSNITRSLLLKRENEEIIFIELSCIMRSHPISGELLCLVSLIDVSDENVRYSILNKVISQNYDYAMVINPRSKTYVSYMANDKGGLKSKAFENYSKMKEAYIRDMVAEYDVERALYSMNIDTVVRMLEIKPVFDFLADVYGENGKITKKLVQYSYLDEKRYLILQTRQDVTEVITKENSINQQLENALKTAEQANHAKTDFLTRMSHEMRTPMNAIIGLTALAEDETHNPDILLEYIKKIRFSSDFLLKLINDVLDMAKIEEKRITLTYDNYRFGDFVEVINTMIQPMSRQKKIQYSYHSTCSPDTVIVTDKLRMNQVFINLLANAVKYTNAGGTVEFECQEMRRESRRIWMRFQISDNGIGMSEEFQKNLFKPFNQESSDVSPQLQGTGLGLAIAKSIVEMFDGKIMVDSKKGVGTTFTILLTFETVHEEPKPEKKEVVNPISKLGGKRVLIVEDNPINQEIAVAILEKYGMVVTTAENGQEAVDIFAESEIRYFDIVLMDIRMPVMDGLEATKRIRLLQREDASSVPILAMTANAFTEDVIMSKNAGMNAHLTKPIEPKVLAMEIAKRI